MGFRFALLGLALAPMLSCAPEDNYQLLQTGQLQQGQAEVTYEYVRVERAFYEMHLLGDKRFQRDHAYHPDYVLGYLERMALHQIKERSEIVPLNETEIRHGLRDPFDLQPTKHWGLLSEEDFEDYHDYDELTAELAGLADQHPELLRLETAGQSVQGRELWYTLVASPTAIAEQKPKLLYIANMHGDEVVGRELMIYLIRLFAEEYGVNKRITQLLDQAQIFIMPTMNPDGFENGRRYNANGRDLNRNFPDFTTDPDDTPAGRQPETQAVMALHEQHHFVAALNLHGGEVCVNMPWDTASNRREIERFGDDPLMTQLARAYADANPTMVANDRGPFDRGVTYGYEWYEVDGGLQDWANHYRNSFHATLELSYSKWPPARQLPALWQENREPLLAYLESALHGFHLQIVDASGEPVHGATMTHSDSRRAITYPSDRIHRAANPGTWQVTLSKDGYDTYTGTLNTADLVAGIQTITLQKAGSTPQ